MDRKNVDVARSYERFDYLLRKGKQENLFSLEQEQTLCDILTELWYLMTPEEQKEARENPIPWDIENPASKAYKDALLRDGSE